MAEKCVFAFDEIDVKKYKDFKALKLEVGGKAAGLVDMTKMGFPIPPGFVIPCRFCTYYSEKRAWPAGMREQVEAQVHAIEKKSGRKLGDAKNPLLLSVRSGAPESMPGMMDTVLNLGMNQAVADEMAKVNERFAMDAWRRFVMMYADIVMGTGREHFSRLMDDFKAKLGKKDDKEMTAAELRELSKMNLDAYQHLVKKPFPQNPLDQLYEAVNAVFRSWDGERAVEYRKRSRIPNYGTAVTVMKMVFGNLNDNSGTGVLFTRDVNDGEKRVMGEFLEFAQGEDVVAGVRTPMKLEEYRAKSPASGDEIYMLADKLEKYYRDVQDCEFTVEDGKVWFLQTRSAKRAATAAVKAAMDMLKEGLITEEEAVLRVPPTSIDQLLYKRVSPKETKKPLSKGFNASPGCVTAKAVFDCKRAQEAKKAGVKVLLCRKETKPEDFPGMVASVGILTSRGGKTCHAAVVARGIGLPAVVGAGDLVIDEDAATCSLGGKLVFKEGDLVTIDGLSGNVFVGEVMTITPEIAGDFKAYLDLCDKTRDMKVRANADTPQMAADAIKNGAEGIGLCRTERMFNAKERLPKVVEMILADTPEQRAAALDKLLPLQREDFVGLFTAMTGKPVIVRLLDPPLHEFLPNYKNMLVESTLLQGKANKTEEEKKRLTELEYMLRKSEELHEDNAMLGHRGIRLGNTTPEIYKMQVRALVEAVVEAENKGVDVHLEIMLPMTAIDLELSRIFTFLKPVMEETLKRLNHTPKHKIMWGTMIETPRACLTAEKLGAIDDFFSFGTNDLTQTTFAFSRDDAEGKFLNKYLEFEPQLLKDNPFEVLDTEGVGKLVDMAVRDGRAGHKDGRLEIGVCGETGGEPSSIIFYYKVGLDYVSCSPFRIPVARVAAAHATVMKKLGKL